MAKEISEKETKATLSRFSLSCLAFSFVLHRSSFCRVVLQPWAFTQRSCLFSVGCFPFHFLYPTVCCDIFNHLHGQNGHTSWPIRKGIFHSKLRRTASGMLFQQLRESVVIWVCIPFGVFVWDLNQ
ncbi:hypothetical protein mRhiFer1_007985 [Rhinolophus ferrumequinum]|uniref:Uncharacterized protein n=1 Tax=Rhinolophus ferrumequinum TaxID=59479 RepID=A0A7J8AVW7_RHIFE|nr:hypothetical protein mRhiFer1_007985 [Rhinolophus ferrumequinum]